MGEIDFGAPIYGIGNATPKGTYRVDVAKDGSNYILSNLAINMTIIDGTIEDFNYFNDATIFGIHFPWLAAMTQCGHGLNGNTIGQVYTVDIILNREYDFTDRTLTPE